ncbi:unnamed protein product [Candidula unifasciata]|uniref:C1q domain-containing protein n=1 Tax=Candidula unifasciata TaxID=100452 RepID=A0A8S3ZRD3_9EUPU|nr:unnamed protein product [Candidula unifasciata]
MLLTAVISLGLLSLVHGQCALKTVAFTAALSHSQTVDNNQVVVYDNTITNHGLGYDNKTGIFTAPAEGFFLFHLHLLKTKNQEAWLELFHNDDLIVSAYAQNSTQFDAAGNSVILWVMAGDRVDIRAHRLSGLFGKPDELYTTFSGHYVGAKS